MKIAMTGERFICQVVQEQCCNGPNWSHRGVCVYAGDRNAEFSWRLRTIHNFQRGYLIWSFHAVDAAATTMDTTTATTMDTTTVAITMGMAAS